MIIWIVHLSLLIKWTNLKETQLQAKQCSRLEMWDFRRYWWQRWRNSESGRKIKWRACVGGEERWWWERRRDGERVLKLPFLFPQHQLCGFYEEQMFTTWYSASSPSTHYLWCQHNQLSTRTCAHTHTESHSGRLLYWVYLPASWGLFTVHFPLSPGCMSRF